MFHWDHQVRVVPPGHPQHDVPATRGEDWSVLLCSCDGGMHRITLHLSVSCFKVLVGYGLDVRYGVDCEHERSRQILIPILSCTAVRVNDNIAHRTRKRREVHVQARGDFTCTSLCFSFIPGVTCCLAISQGICREVIHTELSFVVKLAHNSTRSLQNGLHVDCDDMFTRILF